MGNKRADNFPARPHQHSQGPRDHHRRAGLSASGASPVEARARRNLLSMLINEPATALTTFNRLTGSAVQGNAAAC